MKRLTLICFLILALSTLNPDQSEPTTVQASSAPVVAFYYAWYDSNSWNPARVPDQPVQQYSSTDAGTIDRHIQQAQSAGIDGFVQSWYGPGGGNQTEGNFQTLLNLSSGRGFKAAVDFEAASPYFNSPEDRVAALQYLLSSHVNHPAYLRVDGKPVIFFWASWLLTVDQWNEIRNQVDPDHSTIWMAEGASIDYLSVFDGLHLYNVAWSDYPAGTLTNWASQVRARAGLLGSYRYWAATVMPGWDDTRIPGRTGTFYRDRAGGQYYRECWSGAAASAPDMVIITSFNEWQEGSQIEPSISYGSFYLDLTAELAGAFKSGSAISAGNSSSGSSTISEPATELPPASTTEPSYTPGPSPTLTNTPSPSPTFTPRPTPTAMPDGSIVHTVEDGDTLIGISELYSVTLASLLELNDIDVNGVLWIGQPIVIGKATVEPTIPSPTQTVTPTATPTGTDAPSSAENETTLTLVFEPGKQKTTNEQSIVVSAPTLAYPASPSSTPVPTPVEKAADLSQDHNGSLLVYAILAIVLLTGLWLFFKRSRHLPPE